MRNYGGFVLGIVVGCVGLLAAQLLFKSEADAFSERGEVAKNPLNPSRERQQLSDARDRIAELEAEVAAVKSGELLAAESAPGADHEDSEKPRDKAASFIEMMMSLGDSESQRNIDEEVARLAGTLGLSENQQTVLRDALLKKLADGKSAGLRLVTGEASLADLMAADEHNFTAVDTAVESVLDAAQLVAYEAEQEAREVRRIEMKTDEELGALSKAAKLTTEQEEAAWSVLADIHAGEKPGGIPEGSTTEDFLGIIDGAVANRMDGLAPILNDEQLEVYRGQTEGFRKMVTTLVGHAVGSGEE